MAKIPKQSILFFIVLALVIGVIAYSSIKKYIRISADKKELQKREESFFGNSNDLINTAIVLTLDSPLQPGKNNIWCSSFQLAWNEMKDNVIKEPILVKDAQDICIRLNSAKQAKTDLLWESYYAAAGRVSDGIIQKIQTDMSSRFPSKELPAFDSNENTLIAYAYLETYIKFIKPFLQGDKPLVFKDSSGKQVSVKSFGIWDGFLKENKPLCEQIEVLYCKIEDFAITEFALDLCKQTEPYQVVIAVTNFQDSLESTYNKLQAKITTFKDNNDYETSAHFQSEDVLCIPDMFWKITHHFNELEDKSLTNINFQGMPVSAAVQMIQFRLDRSGVTLKSESKGAAAALPREFVFDKPFLLYLKKRDTQQPFFVMWVDNAELLTPFENNQPK